MQSLLLPLNELAPDKYKLTHIATWVFSFLFAITNTLKSGSFVKYGPTSHCTKQKKTEYQLHNNFLIKKFVCNFLSYLLKENIVYELVFVAVSTVLKNPSTFIQILLGKESIKSSIELLSHI